MEKKPLLEAKNDVVFKTLFSRSTPKITKAMLEAMLNTKINKLELDKSTDLLNDNEEDKNGRLDLRAIIDGNVECDIEVQLETHKNMAERFVYYWAKMYAANLRVGHSYSDLRKTICIVILDDVFQKTKGIEDPKTVWKVTEDENKKQILTDHFELVIIELPKALKAYKKNKNDELLQWLMFLDNAKSEEVTQIMEKNEDIKEAKEELEKISQDDILRRRALSRTLDIADRLQFEKEAREAEEEAKEAKEEAKEAKEEAKEAKEEAMKAKEEAKKAKEEAKEAKEEATKAKKLTEQTKNELKQSQNKLEQAKNDVKQVKEIAQQEKIEIIKKMHKANIPTEQIVQIVGIKEAEVNKILNEE